MRAVNTRAANRIAGYGSDSVNGIMINVDPDKDLETIN